MTEDDRLAHLVEELASKRSYAIGGRQFPQPVSEGDAIAIAEALAISVDEGTSAREHAAAEQGMSIACHDGCNYCCEVPVMIFRPEALAAARWLARPENSTARARFLDNYPRWRDAIGDAPAQLSDLFARADPRYEEELIALWKKRILCAFNHEGHCVIYPVRPIGCRNAHALDTNDRCRPDHPKGSAEALSFIPLDQFMLRASSLLRATHNAMTAERHRLEIVCEAVHRLVAAPDQ